MTDDDLLHYRLKALEDGAVGARQAERDVDTLKLSVAHMEGEMTALRAEIRERDEHLQGSLARLHTRLDEITKADSFNQGREEGRSAASTRTWKVVAMTATLVIAFGGLVVALLTLVLH